MERLKKQAACLDLKSEMYFPDTTGKALLCLSGIVAATMKGGRSRHVTFLLFFQTCAQKKNEENEENPSETCG